MILVKSKSLEGNPKSGEEKYMLIYEVFWLEGFEGMCVLGSTY